MISPVDEAGAEAPEVLVDDILLTVRPISPEDAGALQAFHAHLSSQTIYLRYFYPHHILSASEIEHLTRVDGVDRLALVVEHDGQLVAVGRYDRLAESGEAEVAFVVADEFQHHGIGTFLLQRLADAARSVGIVCLTAEVLAENHTMLDVFFGSGFPIDSTHDCGVVELRLSIDQASNPGAQPGTHHETRVPPPSRA
jgi:GNAT superfamily N-acetyltransferase